MRQPIKLNQITNENLVANLKTPPMLSNQHSPVDCSLVKVLVSSRFVSITKQRLYTDPCRLVLVYCGLNKMFLSFVLILLVAFIAQTDGVSSHGGIFGKKRNKVVS